MSFLIIESGSTKADWAFVIDDEVTHFQTQGMNPSTTEMNYEINRDIISLLKKIEKVYFYGAGVVQNSNENVIKDFFIKINSDLEVCVDTDLTAAIKSSVGDKEGIVCILGTGSHSCVYDGEKIINSIPSLGYLISDEGSGNHIGKEILKSYFYNEMNEVDKNIFEENYKITRAEILEKLYKTNGVSAYLASYTFFLNSSSTVFRKKILAQCFEEFIKVRIKKYEQNLNFELYFVGSIAYNFQEELKEALAKHNLNAREIIDRPMNKLIEYHKTKIYAKRD